MEAGSKNERKRKCPFSHGRFVIPTKSFVKIGITKIFCYNNKMFSSIDKTFGCCSKIFGCTNKKIFVVPNFVAVTKPCFSVQVAATTLKSAILADFTVCKCSINRLIFRPTTPKTRNLSNRHWPEITEIASGHLFKQLKKKKSEKNRTGFLKICSRN